MLDADEFLAEAKKRDPVAYAKAAAKYPVISARARRRDRRGRIYEPTDKREPLSAAARQRYLDQQEERDAYLEDWRLDYALAKELADQGF